MILPETEDFFIFGMGNRRKLLFFRNRLTDIFSGEILHVFPGQPVKIVPEEYLVQVGEQEIRENEEGIFLKTGSEEKALDSGSLKIPEFEGNRQRAALKILFHEIAVNIVDGKPLPNLFVYRKPWYRDAAMMCMVLEKTGNIDLVRDWICSLDEMYDRNNAGNCEPDNLGQALYMISLVSDRKHPLVEKIVEEAEKRSRDRYIAGITDGEFHPVYQTKWLKLGLQSLGIPDPYLVPDVSDTYASLFWMDGHRERECRDDFSWEGEDYPYLQVARAHTCGRKCPVLTARFPMTWEKNASEADYRGNLPYFKNYYEEKLCAPHTWHASELFLWLMEE